MKSIFKLKNTKQWNPNKLILEGLEMILLNYDLNI